MQYEGASLSDFLVFEDVGCQVLLFDGARSGCVLRFGFGQITQQLASAGVCGALHGQVIEAAGLVFHLLDGRAHGLRTYGTDKPESGARNKAFHVLTTYKWNVLAETRAVKLYQAGAVPGLFSLHVRQHFSRSWVRVLQALGEFAVDAAIFLFQGDG